MENTFSSHTENDKSLKTPTAFLPRRTRQCRPVARRTLGGGAQRVLQEMIWREPTTWSTRSLSWANSAASPIVRELRQFVLGDKQLMAGETNTACCAGWEIWDVEGAAFSVQDVVLADGPTTWMGDVVVVCWTGGCFISYLSVVEWCLATLLVSVLLLGIIMGW